MRFALLAGLGLAGLGTFVVAPASGAAAPRPSVRFVVPEAMQAGPGLRARRKGRDVTAGGCTSNYSTGAYISVSVSSRSSTKPNSSQMRSAAEKCSKA